MAGNKNLHAANKAKKDEFYTQLSDIANELKHYKQHFAGKTVFCNCDDPYESNFFKYFALNFNVLGLKKLIATCYDGSPVAATQMLLFEPEAPYGKQEKTRMPHKIVITEVRDVNGDGATDLADVEWLIKNDKNVLTTLQGNGDFRSKECIELLKEADIVVTNPPFSLFREYVAQLIEYEKQFLIIGNSNAITYKECFRLIKENKMWLGVSRSGTGSMWFRIADDFPEKTGQKIENGIRYQTVGSTAWFTNLDHNKRHEFLDLYKQYSADEYPTYDNYDAINVDKVDDIPIDYHGIMGVPITFLGKYNPEQFEITGAMTTTKVEGYNYGYPYVNGKKIYARVLIRKKQ